MQLPSLALKLKTSEISLQPSLIDLFLTGTSAQDCPTKLMYSKAGLFFFFPLRNQILGSCTETPHKQFFVLGCFQSGQHSRRISYYVTGQTGRAGVSRIPLIHVPAYPHSSFTFINKTKRQRREEEGAIKQDGGKASRAHAGGPA